MNSSISTFIDQPSDTMWCRVSSRTCSCSASLSKVTRSKGPTDRSKGSTDCCSAASATACSRAVAGKALKST
ncbi:hypothetical protein D3C84_930510 [compost metagenome]